jgi:hypothetical protein
VRAGSYPWHAAAEYAIACQRNRRNLTDADILRCIAVLDQRKREGRPQKTTSPDVVSGRSSAATAELIGVSTAKIERARTVLDHADEPTRQEVLSGNMSINKARLRGISRGSSQKRQR